LGPHKYAIGPEYLEQQIALFKRILCAILASSSLMGIYRITLEQPFPASPTESQTSTKLRVVS